MGPRANLECGALVYRYFDGGLILRIGFLEIECESDFSRHIKNAYWDCETDKIYGFYKF